MIEPQYSVLAAADSLLDLSQSIFAYSTDRKLHKIPVITEPNQKATFFSCVSAETGMRVCVVYGTVLDPILEKPFSFVTIRPSEVAQPVDDRLLVPGVTFAVSRTYFKNVPEIVVTPASITGFSFEEHLHLLNGKKSTRLGGLLISGDKVLTQPFPSESFAKKFLPQTDTHSTVSSIVGKTVEILKEASEYPTLVTEFDVNPKFPLMPTYPILPWSISMNNSAY